MRPPAGLRPVAFHVFPGINAVLPLKLLLVPFFLLLVSLAGRRWGPGVAGWLAGLPLVVGPILFFIALEQGAAFASQAATAALAAVSASIAFGVAYAHSARRTHWPLALLAASAAWLAVSLLLAAAAPKLWAAAAIAVAALVAAPYCFPASPAASTQSTTSGTELALRMLAGAGLTAGVTFVAAAVGPHWSGLLAVFPVLGTVLAVFSHRAQGNAAATQLLSGMARGFYSFLGFCLVLAIALPHLGMMSAFALAVAVSLVIQMTTRRPAGTVRG